MMHRPAHFDPAWIDFFVNPCPYMRKQMTAFPQFPSLPKELQLKVWEEALPGPRAIYINEIAYIAEEAAGENDATASEDDSATVVDGSSVPEEVYRSQAFTRVPAILQACFLSRQVGLKNYRLAFDGPLRFPIHVDFSKDILCFTCKTALWTFSEGDDGSGEVEQDFNDVKFVWLQKGTRFNESDLALACTIFPGMKHFVEIQANSPRRPHVGSRAVNANSRKKSLLPQTYYPDDNPRQWARLRSFIEKDLVDPGSWKPPVVTVGSKRQWERTGKGTAFRMDWTVGEEDGEKKSMVQRLAEPMECEVTVEMASLDYAPLYGRF